MSMVLLAATLMLPSPASAAALPGEIVYADTFGGSGIYTRNGDGSGLVHVVDEFGAWGPRWSPDGTGFAFHPYRKGGSRRIEWVDADGTNRRLLVGPNELPGGWTVFNLTWSPDGRSLVACLLNGTTGTAKLFSMLRNGSSVTPIAPRTCYPDWSWSQDRIVAIHGGSTLVTMDPDGSNPTQIADAIESPRWSPDGARIVFVRTGVDGNGDIAVVDADGSGEIRLTKSRRYDWSPEWSPAGDTIVWAREDRSNMYRFADLWTMGDDGSNPVALAVTAKVDGDGPDWLALGT